MLKAVVADGNSFGGCDYGILRKMLGEKGIDLFVENCKSEAEIIEKCADADAIFSIYAKFPRNVIAQLKHCKVMVRFGIASTSST